MTRQKDEHGDRCSCCLLAAAVGCAASTIRYSYCQAVLMKRWVMECNHGCHGGPVRTGRSSKWRDVGPIDPIKAILIKNE